ncbi:hypothetical protein BpHYR1_016825 [Brachionus plicatilis]|uniref:Uncharacterized protein n=1 Tax=Brachionus plicatilis TaxID=10195 RepID=A0A3M7QNR8_BRAPC|nr:hypothetical protein BpHYR1_016825 [Brachionus plicatilis]
MTGKRNLQIFFRDCAFSFANIRGKAVKLLGKLKLFCDFQLNAFNKLKLHKLSNRLFELSERYFRAGLSYSVPLVARMICRIPNFTNILKDL